VRASHRATRSPCGPVNGCRCVARRSSRPGRGRRRRGMVEVKEQGDSTTSLGRIDEPQSSNQCTHAWSQTFDLGQALSWHVTYPARHRQQPRAALSTQRPHTMPIKEVETPYPRIDADPHASRVVRYMRPSDYAVWASATAGFPAALHFWGMLLCHAQGPAVANTVFRNGRPHQSVSEDPGQTRRILGIHWRLHVGLPAVKRCARRF
jgi:hypothetical protein